MGFPDQCRACQSPHVLTNEVGSASDQDVPIGVAKGAPPTISQEPALLHIDLRSFA